MEYSPIWEASSSSVETWDIMKCCRKQLIEKNFFIQDGCKMEGAEIT
jgi:hypothetical protein